MAAAEQTEHDDRDDRDPESQSCFPFHIVPLTANTPGHSWHNHIISILPILTLVFKTVHNMFGKLF